MSVKWFSCRPNERLPVGTVVRVKGKQGKVTECKDDKDQHGGPIVVHKVKLTHAITYGNGKYYERELSHPQERYVNYSFIYFKLH